MRGVLETHFRCSECGNEIEFVYEEDSKKQVKSTSSTGITGSKKVELVEYVAPCRKCLEPLHKMKSALSIVLDGIQ